VSDVILDESMYIRGMDADCSTSELRVIYRRAARIVAAIQQKHRWIVSRGILEAYDRAIDSPKRCQQAGGEAAIKSLRDVLADAGRSVILTYPVPDVAGAYDEKDRHMVRAAAAAHGSYLVTMDTRLTKQLARLNIPQNHGFTVVGLVEAEELLL
jgi:predicted nucleic acid-binding protein